MKIQLRGYIASVTLLSTVICFSAKTNIFELLDFVPNSVFKELKSKREESGKKRAVVSVPINTPEKISGEYIVTFSSSGRKVIHEKSFEPRLWSNIGILDTTIEKEEVHHKNLGYALSSSKPITERDAVVVGEMDTIFQIYSHRFLPIEQIKRHNIRAAFFWEREKGPRKLYAVILQYLKEKAPLELTRLESVVLDQAFKISPDEKTIYGLAVSKKPSDNQEDSRFRFFKINLETPLSELKGGRILYTTLLVEASDLQGGLTTRSVETKPGPAKPFKD